MAPEWRREGYQTEGNFLTQRAYRSYDSQYYSIKLVNVRRQAPRSSACALVVRVPDHERDLCVVHGAAVIPEADGAAGDDDGRHDADDAPEPALAVLVLARHGHVHGPGARDEVRRNEHEADERDGASDLLHRAVRVDHFDAHNTDVIVEAAAEHCLERERALRHGREVAVRRQKQARACVRAAAVDGVPLKQALQDAGLALEQSHERDARVASAAHAPEQRVDLRLSIVQKQLALNHTRLLLDGGNGRLKRVRDRVNKRVRDPVRRDDVHIKALAEHLQAVQERAGVERNVAHVDREHAVRRRDEVQARRVRQPVHNKEVVLELLELVRHAAAEHVLNGQLVQPQGAGQRAHLGRRHVRAVQPPHAVRGPEQVCKRRVWRRERRDAAAAHELLQPSRVESRLSHDLSHACRHLRCGVRPSPQRTIYTATISTVACPRRRFPGGGLGYAGRSSAGRGFDARRCRRAACVKYAGRAAVPGCAHVKRLLCARARRLS